MSQLYSEFEVNCLRTYLKLGNQIHGRHPVTSFICTSSQSSSDAAFLAPKLHGHTVTNSVWHVVCKDTV